MTGSDNASPHPAALYNDQISGTVPYYDCFHEETINVVKAVLKEPGLWLDTGCGTGTLVGKCLDVFPKTKFVLVDPSREMMLQAKKKLGALAAGRVTFLEPAATQQLNLEPDLHYDVVTAIQCHHYLSAAERSAATSVCYDALNAGGVFVTFENVRPLTETGIEIGKRNWGHYQLSAGKSKEQVTRHLERFDAEYFPITVEEHLELYRNCGFCAVEILWFSCMQAGFYCVK